MKLLSPQQGQPPGVLTLTAQAHGCAAAQSFTVHCCPSLIPAASYPCVCERGISILCAPARASSSLSGQ